MILTIGNQNITVTSENKTTTKLSIGGNVASSIIYLDKAETAALIAGLKANAPKE